MGERAIKPAIGERSCACCGGAHGPAYPLAVEGIAMRGPHRHARVAAGTPLCLRCTCNVDDSNTTRSLR